MADAKLNLADDDQVMLKQQIVILMDAAEKGVLDGQHGAIHVAVRERFKGHFETGTRYHRGTRIQRGECLFAVCPDLTLKANAESSGLGRGGMRVSSHDFGEMCDYMRSGAPIPRTSRPFLRT